MDNIAYQNEFDGLDEKYTPAPKENVEIKQTVDESKFYTFEEAVTLTETGAFHYFLQIISGICLMAATLEIMGVSMIMPFINREIPSTAAEKGFLASSGSLGVVLSSHAVGFLTDTWGRAKMLRTTLSLSFITSIISAFSVNIWMLIVFRFLTGLIISACQACIYSYVGEFHSKKTRTKYITMLSMFIPLAIMLMPTLGFAILPLKLDINLFGMEFESWRLLLLVNASVRIIPVIGLHIMPESPKYVLMQGNHDKTLKTLRMMFSKNTHKSESEYPVQRISLDAAGGKLNSITGVKDAVKLVWTQTAPLFNKERFLNTTNICFIAFISCGIGQGTFMWFPTILKNLVPAKGSSLTTCEVMETPQNISVPMSILEEESADVQIDSLLFIVLILIGAVFTVTYFVISSVIGFTGKKKMLFCWTITSGFSALALQWTNNFFLTIVCTTILFSINSTVGIVSTVAMEYFPTNVNAMGMCLIMMIGRVGAVVGSNFVGLLLYTNCNIMFYSYFVSCVVISVFSLLLPYNEKPRK